MIIDFIGLSFLALTRRFLIFNTGQFVSTFFNRASPRDPPFWQTPAQAVVRAVIGCNKTARRTKQDRPILSTRLRTYHLRDNRYKPRPAPPPFHARHLQPRHRQVTHRCVALISCTRAEIPIVRAYFQVRGLRLWLSRMSAAT